MLMKYKQFSVRVPVPEVFVLMKYLIVTRRKPGDKGKIAKDISTAQELESFLLENGKKDDFIFYYRKMPKKWRKDLLKILKENESVLLDIFKNSELSLKESPVSGTA